MKDPNERLTTRQAAEEFGVPASTLRTWRMLRGRDARYPRFHKLFKGSMQGKGRIMFSKIEAVLFRGRK